MMNINSLKNHDFVIIGQQPWDTDIGSNCKNIAIELSKNNRVLYVNSPLDRISLIRGKNDPKIIKRFSVIKGRENGLVPIDENLWNFYPDCIVESINWINNHNIFNFFNKRNNKKFANSIKKALDKLGFKHIILFNDNEMFKGFYLSDFLLPEISIYYSRDFMLGVNYWKKHGQKIEPLLIEKSDLCFANSTYLSNYCKQYNLDSYYVGQGCDIEDFKSAAGSPKPSELSEINTKIIGYVGSLNSERLDLSIIEHIAKSFSRYAIVLVGPEDDNFTNSNLHNLPNVYFLGQKQVSELPVYVNAFDICINPQLVNEITIGNYPRKIDEYLALGKPVIATYNQTMEIFKDFVYLARNESDYISLINIALKEDSEKRNLEKVIFASTHTWKNSIDEMKIHIEKKIKKDIDVSV